MNTPSPEQIGIWVLIAILLIPTAKVIVDWVKPQEIRPQPLHVKMHEEFASKQDFIDHKQDIDRQMKELRSYVHDTLHAIRGDIHDLAAATDTAREGIHDRLNVLAEVIFEMRGMLRGVKDREDLRHPRA